MVCGKQLACNNTLVLLLLLFAFSLFMRKSPLCCDLLRPSDAASLWKMKDKLTDIERRILAVLQDGLPKTRTPYKDMAEQAGIETAGLLKILNDWSQQGRLRRIGAIVNHFKIGLGAGAMVVWRVEPERTEAVGRILAGFKEVSHAYERNISEHWPYNLYTMVHGASDEQVRRTIEDMSRACGTCDYRVLITERELKKAPPKYIEQQAGQPPQEKGLK